MGNIDINKKFVIIVTSGYTLKKHWSKIKNFLDNSDAVVIGCNIMDFVIPDIYFWSSARRFRRYGNLMKSGKGAVFQWDISKKLIRKYWKEDYNFFRSDARNWKYGSDDKGSYQYRRCCMRIKKKKMYGCFGDCASKAIFWSYMNGASKISLIGVDGYTFYSEQYLKDGNASQNCYGRGMSGGFTYLFNRRLDWHRYKTLRLLYKFGKEKYGFGFEIITPTIHNEFYNQKVLDIEPDPHEQPWVEPKPEEYKRLYFDSRLNRRIPKKDMENLYGVKGKI